MLWPSAQTEVFNVALTPEYSISVALGLKRLDDPGLEYFIFVSLFLTICVREECFLVFIS